MIWIKLFVVLFVTIPSFANAGSLSKTSTEFIKQYNEELCLAANKTKVPAALIASVIIAEDDLNRNIIDRLQDVSLKNMLNLKDEKWWEKWHMDCKALAQSTIKYRFISNKWPIELWQTGYVQSYGSAQITPRTAIIACDELKSSFEECRAGVKKIVQSIISNPDSFIFAGIILQYEKKQYQKRFKNKLDEHIGVWATIYNVGWDYFNESYFARWGVKENNFGKKVSEHYQIIHQILQCGAISSN